MTLRSVAQFRASLLWLYPRRRIADGDTESRRTSMAETARAAGIAIVTGDTKWYSAARQINCLSTPLAWAQSGEYSLGRTDANRRRCIAGYGTLGDHGATILNLREQLGLVENWSATARC